MATNQKLTVGLDLGDRSSRYCILDEAGEVVRADKVATTKAFTAVKNQGAGASGHHITESRIPVGPPSFKTRRSE
jgi:predicted NBD/HSP70 family sugar kinase